MNELKKALKEQNMVFGSDRTLKKLRAGDIKKIFLASNCPQKIKETIEHYAKLSNVEIKQLDIPNEEVGAVCKKTFPITVLCY